MGIERWTPKIKQEQCSDGMTLRMWTDKEGDYVLYVDYLKIEKEVKRLREENEKNIHKTLCDCQKVMEASGARYSWIDPAIDIAKERSKEVKKKCLTRKKNSIR
jgi:hypothetical protein